MYITNKDLQKILQDYPSDARIYIYTENEVSDGFVFDDELRAIDITKNYVDSKVQITMLSKRSNLGEFSGENIEKITVDGINGITRKKTIK